MYHSETTYYRGIKYRSKLESRWARFFDGYDIPYVYESRHARSWGGMPYTPDFYLPGPGQFVEVKPFDPYDPPPDKVREAEAAWRKALALLAHCGYGEVVVGGIRIPAKPHPPFIFADDLGNLWALGVTGEVVMGAHFWRCSACMGPYIDAPDSHVCPCCDALNDASFQWLGVPLDIPQWRPSAEA